MSPMGCRGEWMASRSGTPSAMHRARQLVMTCHLRKQARDATNNDVKIGEFMALAVRHGLPVMFGLFGELKTTTPATTRT